MLVNFIETSKDTADFLIDRDVYFKRIYYHNVSYNRIE